MDCIIVRAVQFSMISIALWMSVIAILIWISMITTLAVSTVVRYDHYSSRVIIIFSTSMISISVINHVIVTTAWLIYQCELE